MAAGFRAPPSSIKNDATNGTFKTVTNNVRDVIRSRRLDARHLHRDDHARSVQDSRHQGCPAALAATPRTHAEPRRCEVGSADRNRRSHRRQRADSRRRRRPSARRSTPSSSGHLPRSRSQRAQLPDLPAGRRSRRRSAATRAARRSAGCRRTRSTSRSTASTRATTCSPATASSRSSRRASTRSRK